MAFLNIYRNLPDPDAVLLNPEKAAVPSDAATLYAMCGALAHRAGPQSVNSIVKYANRLTDEFSVLLVTDTIRREPTLIKTKAFIEWSAKHAAVLI
jgi:hypothetical protein